MDLHANAVLTVRQRQRLADLVAAGVTITAAALVVGCSRQTASKWVNRRRRGESLRDRSSRPHRSPGRTSRAVEQAILRARAELREGPHVIGWALGVAASTVHAVLRRHGVSRLSRRSPKEETVRYERAVPGELVHVDCKKLGRIVKPGHRVTGDRSRRAGNAGWQYLYVAIDDHSRLGFASVYPDETAESSTAFLAELVRFYGAHGIAVERVLTDNGACCKRRWAEACAAYGVAVKKTRAYRPQTNGKAEDSPASVGCYDNKSLTDFLSGNDRHSCPILAGWLRPTERRSCRTAARRRPLRRARPPWRRFCACAGGSSAPAPESSRPEGGRLSSRRCVALWSRSTRSSCSRRSSGSRSCRSRRRSLRSSTSRPSRRG
ncbi:MAG: transposase [Actinobacteria bacterium]|nr:MAG: transposase [Actinomycetota bacterium]